MYVYVSTTNPQSTTHDTTMTSKTKKIYDDEQNRVKSLNDLKHLTNFIINAAVHTLKRLHRYLSMIYNITHVYINISLVFFYH